MRWYPEKAVQEYAGKTTQMDFEETSARAWWRKFVAHPAADLSFARMLEANIRRSGLSVVAVHGNLTCMNVLRDREHLWIIDWETYVSKGPVLVDILSFYLSVHQKAVRRAPVALLSKMINDVASSQPRLTKLDIGAALAFMAAHDIPEAVTLINNWSEGTEQL
jgi:thiamine kinase-like enzyme